MKTHFNVCFIHIEKAGGTTLNDFFLENLPKFWIMPPKKGKYGWRYDSIYLSRLRRFLRFNSLAGHQLAAFQNYEVVFDNPLYVSFVREPVARFISYMNWKSKNGPTALGRFFVNERAMNGQCFRICGERRFEPAKRLIESKPYFLGVSELYDESLFLLQRKLGITNAPFQSSNVTRSVHKRFDPRHMNTSQLEHIRRANSEDIKLYEWITNDLFEQQRANIGWSPEGFEAFVNKTTTFRRGLAFRVRKKAQNAICRLATWGVRP